MNARILAFALMALATSACAAQRERLADVGRPPAMHPMEDPRAIYGRQPVVMPMPASFEEEVHPANALWKSGSRTFFGDPRASKIGDIITVEIDIADEASLTSTTSRSRSSSEDANLTDFLGLQNALGRALPGGYDPGSLADFGASSASSGTGDIDRSESVKLTVAAIVTDILPNGNFVIAGRQEVRVNNEVRELLVSGVARPEDISAQNTIQHTDIAEARISYGGRGVVSDVQKPRWGQEVYEILFPF